MPSAYAKRLKLRLFVEGVEVPIISANVQAAPNSPMVASIQVPPLAEGTRIMPRSIVHLFFMDMAVAESPLIQVTQSPGQARNPTTYQKSVERRDAALEELSGGQAGGDQAGELNETIDNTLIDSTNNRYKLLFGGEVVGFQWTKGQTNRSLVLQCEDWSNYWDYAYQWTNDDIFGPGIKAVFSGGATNLFTDFLSTKGSILTALLLSGRCDTFPKLKGMAAGIVRLIEAVGGSYFPPPSDDPKKPVKRVAGQNIFFSIAELRLHITQMVAAYENDPTSKKLLTHSGYGGMFDRILGGLGDQTSVRKCISALSGVMFHEMYGQPCPYYKPGLDGTVSGQVRVRFVESELGKRISADVLAYKNTISDIAASLTSITDDELKVTSSGLKGYVKTTRGRVLAVRTQLHKMLSQLRGAPETVRASIAQATSMLMSTSNLLLKWTPKSPSSLRADIAKKLTEATKQLDRILDVTVATTASKQRDPARLNQHIFRPDIWFGAPPRCNVIFPENYDQLAYQRMFLQEPTRFLLKTNDEFFGEDFLFDKFYFAPQVGSLKKDKADMNSMLKNNLLDHEIFTGILPMFEKMGEFNVFAASKGNPKDQKIGLAARSANFLYFKHRFNSRQMRISGRFNPYVACGFPGLVVDKYVDREIIRLHNELAETLNRARAQNQQLSTRELSEVLGTNFLGNFTEVSHAVSNQGPAGRTEINCSYPRQPEESLEFLGGVEKVQTIRRKVGEDVVRATDIAALNPPRYGTLGPNNGRVINVVDVTSMFVKGATDPTLGTVTEEGGRLLPVFERSAGQRRGERPQVKVPIGVAVSPAQLGSTYLHEILGGDADDEVVFRAFRVDEEIPRFRREEVELPAEEFIRPGWYGDVWTNQKIGRVYEDFLGIGSITDEQQILDPHGASTGVPDESSEQAAEQAQQATTSDDPRVEAPAALSLDSKASIQQAVEFLLLTYSYIKQSGMNVDEFIQSYTWRPIATMVDMFGTSDLEYRQPTGESVLRGYEGFHSRAFGPYDNLFGLVGADLEDVVGIKREDTRATQRADTRGRKLQAVQAYMSALRFSRAILG